MTEKYVSVYLNNAEKQAILKFACSFVTEETTQQDLLNKRKKWIRFNRHALSEVIGELCYYINRCKSDRWLYFLEELIDYLEDCEKHAASIKQNSETNP